MNSHSTIIRNVGAQEAARLTGATIYAVRAWMARNSIPAKHWQALVAAGHATADELMNAPSAGNPV